MNKEFWKEVYDGLCEYDTMTEDERKEFEKDIKERDEESYLKCIDISDECSRNVLKAMAGALSYEPNPSMTYDGELS